MRTHMIDYVLWCATPVVMIAIAAYMLRGRLQREFPFFFNYVVFQIAAFAVEFPLRNWANYYYVYWVINALGVFVSFAVLLEVVQKIVGRRKVLRDTNIAILGCGVAAAIAVAAAWVFISGHGIDNLTNIIFLTDRGVRLAACVVAVYVVLFGARADISKGSLVFGIAMGFGFFSLVYLLVMFSLSYHAALGKRILSRASGTAYVISTLIWLAYVAAAAKEDSQDQLPTAA